MGWLGLFLVLLAAVWAAGASGRRDRIRRRQVELFARRYRLQLAGAAAATLGPRLERPHRMGLCLVASFGGALALAGFVDGLTPAHGAVLLVAALALIMSAQLGAERAGLPGSARELGTSSGPRARLSTFVPPAVRLAFLGVALAAGLYGVAAHHFRPGGFSGPTWLLWVPAAAFCVAEWTTQRLVRLPDRAETWTEQYLLDAARSQLLVDTYAMVLTGLSIALVLAMLEWHGLLTGVVLLGSYGLAMTGTAVLQGFRGRTYLRFRRHLWPTLGPDDVVVVGEPATR